MVATASESSSRGPSGEEALMLAAVAAAVRSPGGGSSGSKGPRTVGAPTEKGTGAPPASVGGPSGAPREGEGAEGQDLGVHTPEKGEEGALEERQLKAAKRKAYRERRKQKRLKGLFVAPKTNPNVYVCGLPQHFTQKDVAELFKKAGVFKLDPETCQPHFTLPCMHSSMHACMHACMHASVRACMHARF